jgi:hypothetical protein
MSNQEAINLKGILDSRIGTLMRKDPNLSYGPAVKKAGGTFRPGVEQLLKDHCMRLGDDMLVSLYWATYQHLLQRLSELENEPAREVSS